MLNENQIDIETTIERLRKVEFLLSNKQEEKDGKKDTTHTLTGGQ